LADALAAGDKGVDFFLGLGLSHTSFLAITTSPYLPNTLHSFCLWQCCLRDEP
jgi:hypothetical protein